MARTQARTYQNVIGPMPKDPTKAYTEAKARLTKVAMQGLRRESSWHTLHHGIE